MPTPLIRVVCVFDSFLLIGTLVSRAGVELESSWSLAGAELLTITYGVRERRNILLTESSGRGARVGPGGLYGDLTC